MVNHGRKWGWRAAAVKLLLAPVVAAGVALPAVAQSAAQADRAAGAKVVSRNGDPKDLLRQGREALKAGKLDRALDLAKQSDAANATGRWGLFDDTPESLEKDVASARGKIGRGDAEKLAKGAKELLVKPAKTAGERIANLDQAYAMADKAVALAGPSDFFDDVFGGGDRPEKLKKEIDAARISVRKANPGVVSQATAATNRTPGVQQAVATGWAMDPKSVQQAQATGTKIPAPVLPPPSAVNATAVKPASNPRAPAPAFATATPVVPAASGSPAIPVLPVPVMPSAPTPSVLATSVVVIPTLPTAEPVVIAPTVPAFPSDLAAPTIPVVPIVPALGMPAPNTVVVVPGSIAPAPLKPGVLTGAQLLVQARASLRSNDIEMARKLAAQAMNADGASKADAQDLLREIDAESYAKQRKEASTSFTNAVGLVQARQYDHALTVFKLLDADSLTTEQKAQWVSLVNQCETELAKLKAPAAPLTVVAMQEPKLGGTPAPTPGVTTPVAPQGRLDGGLVGEVRALADADYQKLRGEGLESESKALEAYKRGETDLAIQMLSDFTNKVKASKLPESRQGLLLGSVERRLEGFRIMKRQTDFYANEAKTKSDNRTKVVTKQLAEQQKIDEIKKKSAEITELTKKKQYRPAEELALQLKALDPDDVQINALYELTKRQRKVDDYAKLKSDKDDSVLNMLNESEKMGVVPTDGRPLVIDSQRSMMSRMRGSDSNLYVKPLSQAEREIEVRLERPISVEFTNNVTLREAINSIRTKTALNITTDDAALAEDRTALDATLVNETLKDLSVRNVLTVLLDKASLKFVIENDVIRITTEKRARGKLQVKLFSVMELVTPIPDFALAPHQNMAKQLAPNSGAAPVWQANGNGTSSYQNPGKGLGGNAQMVSGQIPGVTSPNAGGTLQNDNLNSPMASSATLASGGRSNHSEQLMRMIKSLCKPYSWQEEGGAGKMAYYDIGGALVVNQTADVIADVQNLLESLRRLQEVSVSIEIRVMSLSESFFERIGVDFAMNIKTKNHSNFEQSLTTGQFRPEPFINSIDARGVTVGYNPTAGGFTSDLGVPVRTNSFGLGLPPFGGYPGPGNGGLGLGLAFLNDIQVFLFMEAAAGDRRENVMQAPKITLFNGQTATVFVSDFAFFTTGLDVVNVGGQFVYIPRNVPIPIGNSNAPIGSQSQSQPGVSVTVQAIVSSDRRFVRMNLSPTLTSLTSATVPLFPVTAFITPVFEGGSQGVPIPFTQFFQQPSISEINVQTTVSCPDGGTVVLGGLKTMSEGRNEFGPPVLSQIPYINRLFRNQGIGRETKHVMIMVTPRIIIQSEEELTQTGGSGGSLPGQ